MTERHPASNLNELWRVLQGLERPASPNASDAVAVLGEMGIDVHVEEGERNLTPAGAHRAEMVTFAGRRLCLGPERDAEVDALLGADFESPLRKVVTLCGTAPRDSRRVPPPLTGRTLAVQFGFLGSSARCLRWGLTRRGSS